MASANPNPTRNESTSASNVNIVIGGGSGIRSAHHDHGVSSGGSGGGGGIGSHPHPGTSGRSPPPSRMASSSSLVGGGGGGGGGRPSIGSTSTTSGVSIPSSSTTANVGRPSFDGSGMRLPPAAAAAAAGGRSSGGGIGMMISGTRLSYSGGSSSSSGGGGGGGPSSSAADDAAGINTRTPAPYQQQQLRSLASPPSTSSTNNDGDYDTNNNPYSQSDFLAALSPSTANFLRRGRGGSVVGENINLTNTAGSGLTIGVEPRVGMEATSTTTAATSMANNTQVLSPASAASLAAENAVRTAANAARGIDNHNDAGNEEDEDKDIDMTDENAGDEFNFDATHNGGRKNQNNHPNEGDGAKHLNSIDNGDDTSQLRQFVQSLLGMQLPASSSDGSNSSTMMPSTMITPDPTSAAFFAISLLTKTAYSSSSSPSADTTNIDGSIGGEGRMSDRLKTNWRPDDAYLAARALSLGGEDKRAIYILDKVGLIGFGMEGAGSGGGGGVGADEEEKYVGRQSPTPSTTPPISNRQGVRNAILLRAESALLAGQCLIRAGDYERASIVYEEATRYPPPPPPISWGMFGYGYRPDDIRRKQEVGATIGTFEKMEDEEEREDKDFDALLADEMYLRSWREQSLSHAALIDDGDDVRLLQLASSIRPLPFSDASTNTVPGSIDNNNIMAGGIHPMARLCAARGIAFDAMSNPHRAISFLKAALNIDARCMEALDYVIKRRLLTPEEEREWINTLNFGAGDLGSMGTSWLRDAYLARLRGIGGVVASANVPLTSLRDQSGNGTTTGVSPVPRLDMQSPSILSLGSPDFAGGAILGDGSNQALAGSFPPPNEFAAAAEKTVSISRTIDEAFHNLAITHNLGHSPDVLSHAAIRAYALHDLHSALAYCTAIDAIDPYCRTAGYVHVATLVGLTLKRRLFQLAHRLVDTDPKDALAWFAVGSYYYTCRRYDLAQRHFSRSTRLDPSSAECWIGFGCSFAACDESDQALASFRAAQNKYSGSHVPLLYMGMEYLRTNHLSLAGHFLNSAQRTDPYDMLCCNELGVWSYRQGDMKDAAFWFLKALRLQLRAEGSSSLNSVDEGLGVDGFILLTGKSAKGVDGNREDFNDDMVASTPVTPYLSRRTSPPVSTVLCAIKTPSGHSIAASLFSDTNANRGTDLLTDIECVERCQDPFWEPTIFNLGQSFRKMKRYADAIVCFDKCTSLCPGNHAAYAALGFAKHLGGDVDGAIDIYHKALSRKPEDNFTSEMLTRALAEAVIYPPSLAMLSSSHDVDGRFGGLTAPY